MEAVTEMARSMGLGVDAADRYGRITDAARKVLVFDRVTIARLDSEGRTIASLFDSSKEPSAADEGLSLQLEGSRAGAAIAAGSAVLDRDGQSSAISAPIVFRGVPAGAVTFESSRAGCYSQDDVPFVEYDTFTAAMFPSLLLTPKPAHIVHSNGNLTTNSLQ